LGTFCEIESEAAFVFARESFFFVGTAMALQGALSTWSMDNLYLRSLELFLERKLQLGSDQIAS